MIALRHVRLPVWIPAILATLAVGTCSREPAPPLTGEQRASLVQNLVVRGVAHAEVGEWPEAVRRFQEALEIGGDDPVLRFDLGVAHLRNDEPEAARVQLDRVGPDAPRPLAARAEYVRGKLALETGDASGESSAYRRAMEIDPSEPAYPYALAQVLPRLRRADAEAESGEIGALLERALGLWPDNSRLGAELAQWALGRPEASMHKRGLELLTSLAEGDPRIEPLLARGRAELDEASNSAPVSLRRALNLLRPGKRFQTDSAALEARLALLPLAELTRSELERRSPPLPVEIRLERANLLPDLPLSTGETILQVVAFNDSVEPDTRVREANLVVLTDRGLWFLGLDAAAFERIAVLREPRHLLVGELDGDGWMEILAFGQNGISAFARTETSPWRERALDPQLASFGSRRTGILTDFEHDGDLDLLLIDDTGRLLLATHRGESGLGPPEIAPLAVGAVSSLLASDLDGDLDQDLVIALDGKLVVFENWRQGEYRATQELSFPGTGSDWLSVDLNADGRSDLAGIADGRLVIWRNLGSAGLERDEAMERDAAEALGALGDRVRSVAIGDLDRDAALDLLVAMEGAGEAGEAGALAGLNELDGRFERIASIGDLADRPDGLVVLDLDGDADPDPLVWSTRGLRAIRSTGGETRGRLTLSLRGLKGKVPLDARGVRLETWLGLDSYVYQLDRPHVVVGLGGREPALVKVTWPNGISEYLFDPEVDSTNVIEQELRIEGSCPFLYASDGTEMRFVTDILGLAPLGMLMAPGQYVPADPEEYLRLPDWVSARGTVELRITEELREVAYIDQSELVVVDTPPGVEVYNGERWIQGRIEGLDLRLLGPLEAPVSVRDAAGRDVLEQVRTLDHVYLAHSDGDRLYQGARPRGHLEIEISSDLARTDRVSLVLTGWLHWGNTSTSVARGQDPLGAPVFPYLEVPTPEGTWRRVDLDVGLPAGKTKPVVVDLSGLLNPDDARVRITTDFEVYWDRIAVAETRRLDQTAHQIHRLEPRRAELTYGGFSRWYRPAEKGPYLFDYTDRRLFPSRPTPSGDRAIAWQEHEGFYTNFGAVTDLVRSADDRLVVFGSGEELSLSFDTESLPRLPEGWRRTLFLHSEGWEKDGDPNVACSQTVGPLPSRNMQEHPCPQSETAAALENADRRDRWVDRDRLDRRVRAWN